MLFIAAICWSIYSWLSDASNGQWFARSGAILVFVSICIQNSFMIVKDHTANDVKFQSLDIYSGDDDENKSSLKFSNKYTKIDLTNQIVSFLLVIIGTLIWAYGDLAFRNYHNVI